MKKIAVYGSLKKGMYNYRESMGDPIGYGAVQGEMRLCHSYPHLYPLERSIEENMRVHVVEIYEIDDAQYDGIMSMEVGAGYDAVDQNFGDHTATIFYKRGNSSDSSLPVIVEYSALTVPQAVRN